MDPWTQWTQGKSSVNETSNSDGRSAYDLRSARPRPAKREIAKIPLASVRGSIAKTGEDVVCGNIMPRGGHPLQTRAPTPFDAARIIFFRRISVQLVCTLLRQNVQICAPTDIFSREAAR